MAVYGGEKAREKYVAELEAENRRLREAAGNGCGVCHCKAIAALQSQNAKLRRELQQFE